MTFKIKTRDFDLAEQQLNKEVGVWLDENPDTIEAVSRTKKYCTFTILRVDSTIQAFLNILLSKGLI